MINMKIVNSNNIKSKNFTTLKNKKNVEAIISTVKKNGDIALKKHEKKICGADITNLKILNSDINYAYSKVTNEQINAIKFIKRQLSKTELALKKQFRNIMINVNGTKIQKSFVPINDVGCYVPGGLARYPSSLVMAVIPAKIAGVKRIVVVSPSNKYGMIDPLILVTADICGVTEFYKTGGAHAIAALAYGTESIKPVNKIVGPGGTFVTSAKFLVSDTTSIDMIAGPTELSIIADITTNLNFVACDIISQAEHDPNTICNIITTSNIVANKIKNIIDEKIKQIKRKKIVKESLTNNGSIIVCKNQHSMINLINDIAPEHLEIITKNPNTILSKIRNAGIVLVGKYTPASASDYALGSNHILPTNGFGRTRGSLSVFDFMKIDTKIESTKSTLKKISNYIKTLTQIEDLPNHYESINCRLT